jgi:hypothetical protein
VHIGEGLITTVRNDAQIGVELRNTLLNRLHLNRDAVTGLDPELYAVNLRRMLNRSFQQRGDSHFYRFARV